MHLITLNDTHTHTHTQSVGLLWTRDRSVAETSDNRQHSKEADIQASGGIRTGSPRKREAADLHLSPRGHRDRP